MQQKSISITTVLAIGLIDMCNFIDGLIIIVNLLVLLFPSVLTDACMPFHVGRVSNDLR